MAFNPLRKLGKYVILNRLFASSHIGHYLIACLKLVPLNSEENPPREFFSAVHGPGLQFQSNIFQPVQPSYMCGSPITHELQPISREPSPSLKRQRRVWKEDETLILWEHYERAYCHGNLSSKTSKVNSSGWESVLNEFNEDLNQRNMPPRSLQQIKEKVNNLKSEHKKIKDRESQTGQGTQKKPFWFEMVDRVFGNRDEVVPPFLFDASKSGFTPQPSKQPSAKEDGNPHEGSSTEGKRSDPEEALSLSSTPNSDSSKSDVEIAVEPQRSSKKRKTRKIQPSEAPVDQGINKKELLSILEKQVDLLERGQKRDDEMMRRIIDLEAKSEERQKDILMAIINKL